MVCSGEIPKLHLPSLPFHTKWDHLSLPRPRFSFLHKSRADQRKRGVLLLASPPRRAQVGSGVPQLLLATLTSGLLTHVLNHQS